MWRSTAVTTIAAWADSSARQLGERRAAQIGGISGVPLMGCGVSLATHVWVWNGLPR